MASIVYDVDGTIVTRNVTTGQIAKLQDFLTQFNTISDIQYTSVNDYLDAVLVEAVKSYIKRVDEIQEKLVLSAYQDADTATKDQVDTLLGV